MAVQMDATGTSLSQSLHRLARAVCPQWSNPSLIHHPTLPHYKSCIAWAPELTFHVLQINKANTEAMVAPSLPNLGAFDYVNLGAFKK